MTRIAQPTSDEVKAAEKVILYCAQSKGISLSQEEALAILCHTTFVLRWFLEMPFATQEAAQGKFPISYEALSVTQSEDYRPTLQWT